jgi:hypothetical protein
VIRSLRRGHLVLAAGLAVVAPGLVALSLAARPGIEPGLASLPRPTPAGGVAIELAPDFPVRVVASVDSAAGLIRFLLEAPAPLRAPDPVLYWSPSRAEAGAAVSPSLEPVLIGAVGQGRATSAEVARSRLSGPGYFLVISVPSARVLAISPGRVP